MLWFLMIPAALVALVVSAMLWHIQRLKRRLEAQAAFQLFIDGKVRSMEIYRQRKPVRTPPSGAA